MLLSNRNNNARIAYLRWLEEGKPRMATFYEQMYRSRALFKFAVRSCKRQGELLKADNYAQLLIQNDPRKFW